MKIKMQGATLRDFIFLAWLGFLGICGFEYVEFAQPLPAGPVPCSLIWRGVGTPGGKEEKFPAPNLALPQLCEKFAIQGIHSFSRFTTLPNPSIRYQSTYFLRINFNTEKTGGRCVAFCENWQFRESFIIFIDPLNCHRLNLHVFEAKKFRS